MHQRCYASAHQLLAQMPGAKVSWLLSWQTSLQDGQCHALCTLGKSTCVDLVSQPISVYGACGAAFAFALCEQSLHEIGHRGKQLSPPLFDGHFSINMVMTGNSRFHRDGSWGSAGVAPEMNLRIAKAMKHAGEGSTPFFKTQGRCYQESKISGSTKKT